MANRSFGAIRKLPSGRWQARYPDPVTGDRLSAPDTFASKGDAARWLAELESDVGRGNWVDPRAGEITLGEFAVQWVEEHPSLRPRTREVYRSVVKRHIAPTLGLVQLNELAPSVVRRWHSSLLKAGQLSQPTVAKCYRILHAIMQTALVDELIVRNPCVVSGASVDRSEERPVASMDEVKALAGAVDERYRALILTATLTGLRLGELLGLRRRHVDLLHATVTVTEQLHEMADGSQTTGPPKSFAGKRVVSLPRPLVRELEVHLGLFAQPGIDGYVFTAPEGGTIRRGNFRKRVWLPAVQAVGVPNLRFHDLRHTGNTMAAATGASTKELMSRMGHASARAALIYQHATRERDEAIANGLGAMFEAVPSEQPAVIRRLGVSA